MISSAVFAALLASAAVCQDPVVEQKQEARRLAQRALDNSRSQLERLVDMRLRYDLGIISSLDEDVVRVEGDAGSRDLEQMNHDLDNLQAKNTVLAGEYDKVRRLVDDLHAKAMAAANEVDPGQFVPVPRQGERASTTTSRAAAPAGRDVVTAPAQPQQPVAARDPQQVLLATLELDPPQAQIHGSEDHQRVAQSLFKAGQALLDRAATLRAQAQEQAALLRAQGHDEAAQQRVQGQAQAARLLDDRGRERLDRALAELAPLLGQDEPPYVALFYQARCLELLFRFDERYGDLTLGSTDYQKRAQQVRAPWVQITARDVVEQGADSVPQPGPWSAAAKTAMEHFRWMNINGRYDAAPKIDEITWPGADRR